jgi:hypothetical protein
MSNNDRLVKQIKEQISIAGAQVKQRMKDIQLELLEELKDESDKGFGLH